LDFMCKILKRRS